MAKRVADVDLPLRDLQEVLALALSRGGELLTAGELLIARRIEALKGPPGRLFARLAARVPEAFAVDKLAAPGVPDIDGALLALAEDDLVDHLVSDETRGGPELFPRRWVRVRHRALMRRLAQWALLQRRPDLSRFVVERLGHVQWPVYPLTTGGLFRDRRALLAWESLYAARDELPVEDLLAALAAESPWPPGRLDLRPSLVRRVMESARERERSGDPAGARELYLGLVEGGDAGVASVAIRVARTLEAEGRADEALTYLESARVEARGADRIALGRTGRRLAASLRRGWSPDRPSRMPAERHLVLAADGRLGSRPAYRAGGARGVVEQAVAASLAEAGRQVVHAEGPLWTTLFALLFADTYFLPVPGMLPVRFLSGPLDLGSPTFAQRRWGAVCEVLAAVAAGEAPMRIRQADARWRGTALAGASWERADGETLAQVAQGVGSVGLGAVMETLLTEGWQASRGLPDLVVLAGQACSVPAARPEQLATGALLVEVKGPTDSVRDEQAVWFDRLLGAQVAVELWRVAPTPR